jgi:hypothetical protein
MNLFFFTRVKTLLLSIHSRMSHFFARQNEENQKNVKNEKNEKKRKKKSGIKKTAPM